MLQKLHPHLLQSIESWAGGPTPHGVVTLSREDFEKLLNSAHRAHPFSVKGQTLSASNGNLTQQGDNLSGWLQVCTTGSSDDQPQDLSISRTQSQPEICRDPKSATSGRAVSKMEQKQKQWERERAELQAMQNWGPPSMVGTPYTGRKLQPVATVTPQLAPIRSSEARVTNILNMENANQLQFTDHQSVLPAAPMSGRYSMADEAKKRLGSLGSDVVDPEILRMEKVHKAAEYRRAIEQQVEEKRQRQLDEKMKTKLEEEMAERRLNEERDKLRKQYEEEQMKIRLKEDAEERTRLILLEKVREAEAAAEEARRIRLRRNTCAPAPQDEFIAASVQSMLKLPSPAPLERAQSRLPNSPPLPAPRRTNSGFLATSSNLPSAHGTLRHPQQALAPAPNSASNSQHQQQLRHHRQPVDQDAAIVPLASAPNFSMAGPQMRPIYSAAFMDQSEMANNVMLHQQVPTNHKCQAYLESMPSPPRTGCSTCSCHAYPRRPLLTSFYTQTPSSYIEDRVLTPTVFRSRQRSQSLKSLRNFAVQTDWTMSRKFSPPSSAPSSPVNGRASRRRKPASTGALQREKSKRPPWNANVPSQAYVKNTDRDPNMHTRKKLQELRRQHWEREMSQQSAWKQHTRRRISANEHESDRASKSPIRPDSQASGQCKSVRRSSQQGDTSDTDISIANNDTESDFPGYNGYGTDRAIGKGLRDDGVDSSEVSATASAGPFSLRASGENRCGEDTAPAPAPRKTWKSQSMYIPQTRAVSPPVPALLNKMRLQGSDELNTTRGSSHVSNLEESIDNSQRSLSRSKSNVSLCSLRKTREPASVAFKKDVTCQRGVNDQKKILSQLSALRQTLLMKRQELENSISTPRLTRKAQT